jgi:DNA-binding NarL/FixJ family response regulator
VEDNPDDALIEARALQTFGIRKVYAADTAEQALAFLAEHTCDAALIDYNLPGMNGLRLLERIRESWPALRVIVVTGVRDERVAVAALKAGADNYVSKDELVTSSIIRTLQAALREQLADRDEVRRSSVAAPLDAAVETAGWLLESLGARASLREAAAGAAELQDVLEQFERYLRASLRAFPQPALHEEDGLARMFLESGASAAQVLAAYRATVGSLRDARVDAEINPIVCLVRLLVRLLEQYQLRLSLGALVDGR